MSHIIGRILNKYMFVEGYLIQANDGSIYGLTLGDIRLREKEFPNIERVGDVYRERGISDKLITYYMICKHYDTSYIPLYAIMHVVPNNKKGSVVVISFDKDKKIYKVLLPDGDIIEVTEQELVSKCKTMPLYNVVIRNNRVCMKPNYKIPVYPKAARRP